MYTKTSCELCIGFIEKTVDGTTNQEKRIIISIRFNLDNLILNKVDMKMEMDEKMVIAWRERLTECKVLSLKKDTMPQKIQITK